MGKKRRSPVNRREIYEVRHKKRVKKRSLAETSPNAVPLSIGSFFGTLLKALTSTNDFKLVTPERIDPEVVAAARNFSGTEDQPFYVPITPTGEAEPKRCHFNVRDQIEREGGEPFFCWAIWKCKAWIEGDFHCLWRKSDGTLVDVTPDEPGDNETRRLVQPEPKLCFDGKALHKKYHVLTSDPNVVQALEMFQAANRIMSAYPADALLSEEDAQRVKQLQMKASARLLGLG